MSTITNLVTGHVGLNVTDLERSLAFYRTVFDFEVMAAGDETDRRWAFLGRDGRLLVTLWQQSEGTFSVSTPGLHHLSFQVDTIDEVNATAEVLRGLGAEFAYEGVVPHGEQGVSGGVYFTDPDGTRLEIYAPTGADPAAAPVPGAPTCGFF
ncbi:VOC family protein [Streptosporangium longisporum]|uniref:VOC family protein n=1 Tax=Streptosporangium longisporum TaxID=46187 RepID=UPI0039A70F44